MDSIDSHDAWTSPFSRPLAAHVGGMPQPFIDQYLTPADSAYEVVLGGRMDRIWHRPRWLWPIFWLLAKGDILFPETGEAIPTTLVIRPAWDPHGAPIQTWERTFRFRGRQRRFCSTMTYDSATGFIAELEGPGTAIEELTEVRFSSPATIEIESRRSALVLRGLRLGLPRRLWVTARVVQRVEDPATGSSHVALTVTHGTLGPIFGYEGTFRCRRRPRR